MLCNVLLYNDPTQIIVVDYNGTRVQFKTQNYKGGNTVNVLRNNKGYYIATESAKKVSHQAKRLYDKAKEEPSSPNNSGLI